VSTRPDTRTLEALYRERYEDFLRIARSIQSGAEEGGCTPWLVKDPPLLLLGAQRSGDDFFHAGQVPESDAKVEVHFADGVTKAVDTSDGFALMPIPAAETAGSAFFVELRAYDRTGNELAKRGLQVRR
jgi:hypothetical protein